MTAFSPAPAAVARIAAWPVQALRRLEDPELTALAASLDPGTPAALADYDRTYHETVDRLRQDLWALTMGDPVFRCAIAIANPSLVRQLTGRESTPLAPRNKAARHIETTLYRYLARATGRTSPYGLWTEVGIATFGRARDTVFHPCPANVRVDPDLRVFREVFTALGRTKEYRSSGTFRVSPALHHNPDRGWVVGVKQHGGDVRWVELPPSPVWAAVATLPGRGTGTTLAEIELQLAAAVGGKPVANAVVELLLAQSVLVGGVEFPTRYGSPSEALATAERRLHAHDREAWLACRRVVRAECLSLGTALARMLDGAGAEVMVEDILAANDAVRDAAGTLCKAVGIDDVELPVNMLRCNQLARSSIEIGTDDARELNRILEDWAETERQQSTSDRYRRAAARITGAAGLVPLASPDTNEEGELKGQGIVPSRGPTDAAKAPPLGALVFRPGPRGFGDAWIRGLSDSPTATHARHADQLAALGDPLVPWVRSTLAELEAQTGIISLELTSDRLADPNVIARPDYLDDWIDPWGADGLALNAEAVIRLGPSTSAPVLELEGRWYAAHRLTAAVPCPGDPVVSRLLATSFGRLDSDTDSGDSSAPAATKRRCTNAGRPVVPAQTRLTAAEVGELASGRGSQRFLRWTKLAARHGWPKRVRVTRDGKPGVVVCGDSPIAVESVLEGIGGARSVVVEEDLQAAWVESPRGRHVVELVLPVRRTENCWTTASAQEAQRGHTA